MPMNRRKMAGFGAKRLGPVFATLTLLSGCMAGIAPPSMLRMHDKVSPNSVAAQGAPSATGSVWVLGAARAVYEPAAGASARWLLLIETLRMNHARWQTQCITRLPMSITIALNLALHRGGANMISDARSCSV